MSENKIKFPAKLASNNPKSFGIVDALEISGHKSVGALSDLYSISDPILSMLKDGSDAIGQEWFVVSEDCKYRLDNWENRKTVAGWTKLPKQELIDDKQSTSEKDQPSGYAGLDSNGKIPIEKTYGTTATVVDVATYESLPAVGLDGVIYNVLNTGAQYKWSGSTYINITNGIDNAKKNETSIFDCSNGTSTKYYSSLSDAINTVPLAYRTSNRIISYLSTENSTTSAVNYQYHGIDSTTWTDLTKWERIPSQADLVDLRSDLSTLEKNVQRNEIDIEDSKAILEGEKSGYETEKSVIHVKKIEGARVESSIPLDYIRLNTSSINDIYFYPIEFGRKYRIKSAFTTIANCYWGYADELVDSITEEVQVSGEITEEGIANQSIPLLDLVIENNTAHKFLVISARPLDYSNGNAGLYVFEETRSGGILKDVEELGKDVEELGNRIKYIEDVALGEITENEVEITPISVVSQMMIKRPNTVTDYLPLSTSSGGGKLYYFSISEGKKYKIKVTNVTSSYAHWGYANEIRESLNVTFPDVEQAEGKCIDLSAPDRNLYEKIIDNAENYKYIVICTSTSQHQLFDIVETSQLEQRFESIEKKLEQSESFYNIAKGAMDESCLSNNIENYYVGYEDVVDGLKNVSLNEDVVAIGHDDMPLNDLIATRKIYNKYGFTAGFNYILDPFNSIAEKELRIDNTKKMIADGHEIGFHAIFGSSFFWRNPMYDMNPNGGATFAPTLDEMKTDVGNGTNVFGKNITSATTFSNLGYSGESSVANIALSSATEEQWFDAHKYYTLYGTTRTATGLNLEDKIVTKTILEWLEYWYTELIDDSLGYSKYSGTASERFAEDYEGSYPSESDIESGNLSSSGVFVKGLFKGCHSCCNYEVIDRIISIAEAFVRKFFGISSFTNMAYHGGVYINLFWGDENGTLYNNRNKTILATGHTKLYISTKDNEMNLFDILLSHGIKMNKRLYPSDPTRLEGQIGLFKGQKNVRGAFFNDLSKYHINDYLALLGSTASSSGMESVDYDTFISYAPNNVRDWFKWAYENVGIDVSQEGKMYMLPHFKNAIDAIKNAYGTGKIPFLGVDTIRSSASISAAVEMICQYCYRHNIQIVSPSQAMNIANKDRILHNMFPNPTFHRSVLEDCGGESTENSAYIPDGWIANTSVLKPVVNKEGKTKILSVSSGNLSSCIYGLPSGKYKFTAMAKSENGSVDTSIYFAKKYNDAKVSNYSDVVVLKYIQVGQVHYSPIELIFDIEEQTRNSYNGALSNTLCFGYEDNVNHIIISFSASSGDTLSIYNPRIDKVL